MAGVLPNTPFTPRLMAVPGWVRSFEAGHTARTQTDRNTRSAADLVRVLLMGGSQWSSLEPVKPQIPILSTSSNEISSPRRSYRPVVRALEWPAIRCATSIRPPFFR